MNVRVSLLFRLVGAYIGNQSNLVKITIPHLRHHVSIPKYMSMWGKQSYFRSWAIVAIFESAHNSLIPTVLSRIKGPNDIIV